MEGIWLTVLGLVGGIVRGFNKVLDWFKEIKWTNVGKELEQAEAAKHEAEVIRETSEIIAEDRTREETVKRMEDGTF